MRSLALIFAVLAGSAFARTVVVPPQPMSPYADTEVSTNIPFSVSSEHAREIEMRNYQPFYVKVEAGPAPCMALKGQQKTPATTCPRWSLWEKL